MAIKTWRRFRPWREEDTGGVAAAAGIILALLDVCLPTNELEYLIDVRSFTLTWKQSQFSDLMGICDSSDGTGT